jgi:hypothetical protein
MARFNTADSFTLNATRAARVAVYNIPGANTWTVPAGTTCATFELWGAGGGGGAKCCCECYHQGAGGGAGNYTAMTMPVTPGVVYQLCIGAGGMYTETSGAATHWCCQGGAGGPTYIQGTGTGITTLCAGGGSAGINMCYSYCMCSSSYSGNPTAWNSCSVANSASSATVNCIQAGNGGWNTGSTNQYNMASGHVGFWTDSTAYNYKTVAAGAPWQSGTINTTNWCYAAQGTNTTCFAQQGCSLGGQGGQGAMVYCCSCDQAGTGANGLILIRY